MVGTHLWRSGSGEETFLEVRKWSGHPHEGPEVDGTPPGGPELVERLSRRSGSDRDTLPDVLNW